MQKGLRIIQVVNVRWFNATAWYALSLSGLLEKAGHDVLVITLPEAFPLTREKIGTIHSLGLCMNTVNPVIMGKALYRIRTLLEDFRPHIINCHRGEGMLFWAMFKAAGHNFALIRTRGDQRPPKNNIANRYLYSKLSDAVIATNSRTARQCRDLLGVEDSRLHLIPGGVDRAFFAEDAQGRAKIRARYGFEDNDFVVGLLGRFDPVKGHRQLAEAVALVRHRSEEANKDGEGRIRLMLLGLPANISREDMETLLREHHIYDSVLVTEHVDDVPAHISAMDLGVIASQGSEAIARAALEIMSCKVPLLGTDVGVMPDLLSPDALVAVGDTQALAARLERAWRDTNFRKQLALEQTARMPDFSQERFLEQTLAVYNSALSCTNK